MVITRELFSDYLLCRYKAYKKLKGGKESKSDYELLQAELEDIYKREAVKRIISDKKYALFSSLINVSLKKNDIYWNVTILEKENIPLHFCKNNRLSRNEKLLLASSCFILEKLQGKLPEYGYIVYGEQFRATEISANHYIQQVKEVFEEIQDFISRKQEPVFDLQDYCRKCEFCKVWAKERDALQLLKGMSNKQIADQHKKGIFTVTQYSYTFRPRKKVKRVKHFKNAYTFALKALAIREKKIFISERPDLPITPTQIYFDIEGNAENSFHYLIGLLVITQTEEKIYSFWADNQKEEEVMLQQFLHVCSQYKNSIFFHYGSYERIYLKGCKKKFAQRYRREIDRILTTLVNVLTIIYSHIYFPTYSNELKDIARYLGYSWTQQNASGIQSLVWRMRWEMTKDDIWKQMLLQYNIEDCFALKKLTDCIYTIFHNELSSQTYQNSEIAWAKDIKPETNYRLGKAQFFFSEFEYINKCAYFDYQRQKIFIRTKKGLKKLKKRAHAKRKERIDQCIEIKSPPNCFSCGYKKLYRRTRSKKTVYDLKFFQGGVKKWIVQYSAVSLKCQSCKKEQLPKKYITIKNKYGHTLISWVIYQIIVNGISIERIIRNLSDIFGYSIASSTIYGFKTYAAKYYRHAYKSLSRSLIQAHCLHADETKVNLKTEAGYVWVFTNMEDVVFLYKESREAHFLEDLLKGFKGVLITDYYAAYDFLKLPQQKCLIHLMRDLNHDIFQHPFDAELKDLVYRFAVLMKKIIETIDLYGLKKRHLSKHIKDVEIFFKTIKTYKFVSEVAQSYQKRFEKNRKKLFTFLMYDNVPWNNNNAEHALKHFATYRKTADGIFTKAGIEDYLVLLSIYQTCRYKQINFLQFLLSKKKVLGNL